MPPAAPSTSTHSPVSAPVVSRTRRSGAAVVQHRGGGAKVYAGRYRGARFEVDGRQLCVAAASTGTPRVGHDFAGRARSLPLLLQGRQRCPLRHFRKRREAGSESSHCPLVPIGSWCLRTAHQTPTTTPPESARSRWGEPLSDCEDLGPAETADLDGAHVRPPRLSAPGCGPGSPGCRDPR